MIEKDKDITALTTFGIPVKARLFAEYKDLRELRRIVRTEEWRDNEVLHIGGGSNLLFLEDFDGLVLHSAIRGITLYEKDSDHVFVIAGAGERWTDLVDWCVDRQLAGLENLAGIPGECGASAVQNVGAYGREAGDVLHAVECYDTLTGEVVRFSREECRFGYRDSVFKHEARGRYYVLRVSYMLRRCNVAQCLDYGPLKSLKERLGHVPTLADVRSEVIAVRNSKLPDPAVIGSAGSFFKNPVVGRYMFREELQRRNPDIPYYEVDERRVKIPAAWLIDHAGLKGACEGGASVWEQQPLVIANTGGASGADVSRLCSRIVGEVHSKFGIELHPEVNMIDSTIRVTVLGSGTSKGIPEAGCSCSVCRSDDPRDNRQRASLWVRTRGLSLLVDVSPDFRQQAISAGINDVDAALITHVHYDHVGGIDDLRPYNGDKNIRLYMRPDVARDLERRLDYCFSDNPYPGVPVFDIREIGSEPFFVDGVKVIPVDVMHGKRPIVGFRIGDFGYITDAKTIEPEEREKLRGLKVLIVNALRREPHFAHFNVDEALELIEDVKPEQAYFTHMCHHFGRHADVAPTLPPNVGIAYDGMELTIR